MYHEVKFIESVTYGTVLLGYSLGIFPMSYHRNDTIIKFYYSDPRGIIKLEPNFKGIKISRSLKQVLKKNIFEIKVDTNFEEVIKKCSYRRYTWISYSIIDIYTTLHKKGYAHSVETYKDGELVGGLYGVAYKGAFFGESMFHRVPNASKVAFIKLYEILVKNNFLLFDIQMITPVFAQFGAVNISHDEYVKILEKAMSVEREFKY